ncbi:hypothetical protein JRC49_03465 [Clostridiales bacterium FE2011]|nr:hypothetical protein JRC49_03465 [Clostridiales bacterium FE2011]
MFPHLYAMQGIHQLSMDDMGGIIGKSQSAFIQKMQNGSFTPCECKVLCQYFGKSFDYLFATQEEIDEADSPGKNDQKTENL